MIVDLLLESTFCKAPISCERLQIVLSWKRCPAEKSKKFLSHRKMNWPRSDPRTIKPFLWPTFKSLLFPIISTIYPQQGRASFKTFSYLVVKSASPVLKLFPLTDRAGSVGIFSINHLTVINLEWAVQLNYLYKITKHNRKVNNVYHWWPVILGSNETQGIWINHHYLNIILQDIHWSFHLADYDTILFVCFERRLEYKANRRESGWRMGQCLSYKPVGGCI